MLLLLRLWRFRRHRRVLDPLVDLPAIGVAFVLTGGPDSPLDPALLFVYALVAFLVERTAGGLRGLAPYLVGMTALYGVVFAAAWSDAAEAAAERRADLERRKAELRAAVKGSPVDVDSLRSRALALGRRLKRELALEVSKSGSAYLAGRGAEPPALLADLEAAVQALAERDLALERAVEELDEEADPEAVERIRSSLGTVFPRSETVLDGVFARIVEVSEETSSRGVRFAGRDLGEWLARELLDEIQAYRSQQDALRSGLEETLEAVVEEAVRRDEDAALLLRLGAERASTIALLLLTLALVGSLRSEFERAVEKRESERARREVEERRRETENWIALTAGLTHSIGNDILAYESATAEALESLPSDAPDVVRDRLRFIRETNAARLSFVRFLGEFARMRKEGERSLPARGLERVNLVDLLRSVRERVGRTEAADLPRDVIDPQVEEQRRRLLELPLEIEAEEGAAVLPRAQRGVLEFFAYELIKNALRNASGERPIRAEIRRQGERVVLRLVNDVRVKSETNGAGRRLLSLPRRPDLGSWPEEEFAERLQEALDRSFEPGLGGGTGLGLFLIRYFAREFYGGAVRARVVDAARRLVAFELELPADLEARLRGGPGPRSKEAR